MIALHYNHIKELIALIAQINTSLAGIFKAELNDSFCNVINLNCGGFFSE
jgi:hypothetical protein